MGNQVKSWKRLDPSKSGIVQGDKPAHAVEFRHCTLFALLKDGGVCSVVVRTRRIVSRWDRQNLPIMMAIPYLIHCLATKNTTEVNSGEAK